MRCLFLYCTADHRDLHSFPTRRSSDLKDIAKFPQTCMRADRLSALRQWDLDEEEAIRNEMRGGLDVIASGERSEEHTSELQSLAYLVCRLLLEKKKLKQFTQQYSDHLYIAVVVVPSHLCVVFFCTAPPTTEIYTLSLHDALPISRTSRNSRRPACGPTGCRHCGNGTSTRKRRSGTKCAAGST